MSCIITLKIPALMWFPHLVFSIEQKSLFTAVCRSVILFFCHFVNLSKTLTLFQTLCARGLIFHKNIPCDTYKIFLSLHKRLTIDQLLEKMALVINSKK